MSVTLQPIIRLVRHGIMFLAFVVLVAGCGRSADVQETPVSATVAAGGMVVPTPVEAQTTVNAQAAANQQAIDSAQATTDAQVSTTEQAVAGTEPEAITAAGAGFRPGQVLQAVEPLLLYVDANTDAAVMNRYATATQFTVLAPSGDYTAYPIVQADAEWYRLRAADGLVGWATTAQLAALE